MGKPEGKGPLGRSRRRWKDNIKIDLKEVDCDPGDLITLAEDRDHRGRQEQLKVVCYEICSFYCLLTAHVILFYLHDLCFILFA